MRLVNNSEDILDSRDVIDRRDELQEERDSITAEIADLEAQTADDPVYGELDARRDTLRDELNAWDEENAAELAALNAFIAQGSDEWEYGEALVRDSYFIAYAQDFAEDIGAIDADAGWPARCIDWERAARELRMDYTSAEFDGVTYWFRA